MGRRSSDRPRIEDRPPLGVKALMEVVEALVKSKGMKSYRVAYKTNSKGEHEGEPLLDDIGERSQFLVDANALLHEGFENRVFGPLAVDEVVASDLGVRLEHAVDATVPLLHAAGVPRQVEVEEIRALSLEVDALPGGIRADQDPHGVVGVVEGLLDLLPLVLVHPAVEDEDAVLGLFRPGERRFKLVDEVILGVRVLGEDEEGPFEKRAIFLASRREKARR